MFPSSFSDLSDFSERPPWLLVSGSDIGFLIVYWSVYMVFFVLSYLIFRRWNAKVWIQTLWAWWVSNIWTMKISFWDFLLFPNQSIFARIQSWSYFIRIPNKIHVLKPNSLTSDHKGSTDSQTPNQWILPDDLDPYQDGCRSKLFSLMSFSFISECWFIYSVVYLLRIIIINNTYYKDI